MSTNSPRPGTAADSKPATESPERSQSKIQIKRVYDPMEPADGCRLLVDRLWPRGIRKDELHLQNWAKELAPSDLLRRRYHSGQIGWGEFQQEYVCELAANPDAWTPYLQLARRETLTLLIAARDLQQNHGLVLRDFLIGQLSHPTGIVAEP